MTITKRQAVALWNALSASYQASGPLAMSYWMARNRRALQAEVELLQALSLPRLLPEMQEFERQRQALLTEYAHHGPDGQMVTTGGHYDIPDHHRAAFDAAFLALRGTYQAAIEQQSSINAAQGQEFDQLLAEPLEFTPYTIDLDRLPDAVFTPEQLDIFLQCGLLIEPPVPPSPTKAGAPPAPSAAAAQAATDPTEAPMR